MMLLLWPLRKKAQERDLGGTKIVNVVKENSTQKWVCFGFLHAKPENVN